MINLTALAQTAPGSVAVNASLLTGFRIAGVKGAIVSILGTILPPFVIISVISLFYSAFSDAKIVGGILRGMQAGVTAVISDVAINMGGRIVKSRDFISIAVMICAFAAVYCFQINIILIILICGGLGAARTVISKKRNSNANPE